MKGKLLFTLLLWALSTLLVAQNEGGLQLRPAKPTNLKKQEGDAQLKVSSDTTQTTAMTASTLLDAEGNALDTTVVKLPNTYAWVIDTRYGDRTLVPMDTVVENYARSTLVEGQGIAMQYLGNIGGPVQAVEFFQREEPSQFPVMDVYDPWRKTPGKQLFLNTKVPYSNIKYQAGGGKEVAENRFTAELSSNFGKRLNVGFNFDYIYARGYYKALYNKQISYDVNASYIGDKYKMHFFAANNNLQASDNGGILDDRYITNPESEDLKSFRGSSRDIPVMFEEGIRNHMRGRHVFLTNSYDIGKDEEYVMVNDSVGRWKKKKNYIAPASIIFTTHYQDQRRKLFSPKNVQDENSTELKRLDDVYVPNIIETEENGNIVYKMRENGVDFAPKYTGPMNDYMSHYTWTNTFAFRMNEGFKSWTKFGLTVFIEHQLRGHLSPDPTSQFGDQIEKENVFFFGGKLNKNKGRNFKFDVSALKGINTSDLRLEGNAYLNFQLRDKQLTAKVNAYIRNIAPTYFQNNFSSRNYVFSNDFKDTKRVYIGGEISLPKLSFSETKFSGGYENITNYIYNQDVKIGPKVSSTQDNYRREIVQSSKTVNIFSVKASQKLKAGIFHLDLEALLQKTTDEDIIPLPNWTVYANVYLETKISKVLTVQLGADSYMNAEYNAPRYDILLGQFYNQRSEDPIKLGGFPHTNAYINLHLKYTRFFIMAYNISESFGNRKSFTTPHYPTNPFVIKWGLSWRFNN